MCGAKSPAFNHYVFLPRNIAYVTMRMYIYSRGRVGEEEGRVTEWV